MALQQILVALSLALLALKVHCQSVDRCPASARGQGDQYLRVHGGLCYQFATFHTVDYIDAKQECLANGGVLALVKTAAVNRYLLKTLKNDLVYQGNSQIWIGLNDLGSDQNEGDYMWEDGTLLTDNTYENWATNQGPYGTFNHQKKEDCVSMSVNSGKWYDQTCENVDMYSTVTKPYICQYDLSSGPIVTASTLVPITVNTALIHDYHCPVELMRGRYNYVRVFGDQCYLFVLDYEQEYNKAEEECERYNGTLAVVTSAPQNDFLSKTLLYHFAYPEPVWIGLHDTGKQHEGYYDWQDGTHFTDNNFENWGPNQGPHGSGHLSNQEDCVAMDPNDGKWYDQHCNPEDDVVHWPRSFICQTPTIEAAAAMTTPKPTTPTTTTTTTTTPKPTTTVTIPPSPVSMICPNDLSHDISSLRVFNDFCYQFLTGGKLNYTQASQACKNYEGILVLVKNAQVNTFLVNTLKNDFSFSGDGVWIGLNDQGSTGTYLWADGSDLSSTGYSNWAAQPSSTNAGGDCITMNPMNNGKWDHHPCQPSSTFIAVCQYDKALQTIGPTARTATNAP